MHTVLSRSGVPIRLPSERWEHIVYGHPDLVTEREKVLTTVSEPDSIQEGDGGTLIAVRYFIRTPLTSKYCVVVYRELTTQDSFIITAYSTRRPAAWRRTLWQR